MSHLGRPKGVEDEVFFKTYCKESFEMLGVEVKFVDDCVGEEAEEAAANLESGEVLLLENLRFYAEETMGDKAFAEQLI